MVSSVLLGAWLTAMGSLPAQTAVSATYDVPGSLILNEPIVITMRFRNLLTEPVKFDLGWNRTQGFTLVVRGPDGRVHRPTIAPQDVGRVGRIELAPNGEHAQPVLLNDWMAFNLPGRYQLEIRFTTSFVSAGTPVAGPPMETLTLDIGARDEAILQQKYDELVDSYLNAAGGEQRYYAAQLLRHLTDPVAVPMLRRILDKTRSADPIILETLRKVGTPEAVGILREMAAGGATDRAALAKNALQRLGGRL